MCMARRQYPAEQAASVAEAMQHAAAVAEDGAARRLQEAALQLQLLNITMFWYNASDEQGPPGEPCVCAAVLPVIFWWADGVS